MRTMYDACTYTKVPRDAQLVAGYISGSCKWPAGAWSTFPNSRLVRICTNPSINSGDVLDVENGDATPADAPVWAQLRRGVGAIPCIYMSSAVWPAVVEAFKRAGVAAPLYWVAHWDGIAQLPAGAIAKQYADEGLAHGYDLSVVADYWPGVDPKPTPPPPPIPPPPHPTEDPRMYTVINFGAQVGTYLVYDDHVMVAVDSTESVQQLLTLPQCHGERTLDATMYQNFRAVAPAQAPPA